MIKRTRNGVIVPGVNRTVKKGQVWRDNDSRLLASPARSIVVLHVGKTHAIVGRVIPDGGIGRETKIRLDRFKPNSTGYKLVKDA